MSTGELLFHPATSTVEVVFDPKKHKDIEKGSIVGDNKGAMGYLIYPMPSVGAMDRDVDALKDAAAHMMSQSGCVVTTKAARKSRDKALRRAREAYAGV